MNRKLGRKRASDLFATREGKGKKTAFDREKKKPPSSVQRGDGEKENASPLLLTTEKKKKKKRRKERDGRGERVKFYSLWEEEGRCWGGEKGKRYQGGTWPGHRSLCPGGCTKKNIILLIPLRRKQGGNGIVFPKER